MDDKFCHEQGGTCRSVKTDNTARCSQGEKEISIKMTVVKRTEVADTTTLGTEGEAAHRTCTDNMNYLGTAPPQRIQTLSLSRFSAEPFNTCV